jgi:hypothetical protein
LIALTFILILVSRVAPTPFIGFGYVFVFSGTVNDAGTCMGAGTGLSSSTITYDVSSAAGNWFEGAAYEPLGSMSDYIQHTYFELSTPYISVVSTTPGEWYKDAKSTRLEDAFITYLAKDQVAVSAVPRIGSCVAVSGAGAPGVHIQVSFLTTSSAVTSTTNGLYVDKATTTSAVPASQLTPAGPISTPAIIIETTAATQTPSTQPSGQIPDQASNQPPGQSANQPSAQSPTQPSPSPSTAPPKVSQEPGSPSQGESDPPKSPETSKNEPIEPALTPGEIPQPNAQKTTVDSPTALTLSSGEVISSGGQPTTNPIQTTSISNQASNSPEANPGNSQDTSQGTSKVDTVPNTAIQTAPTATSPVKTSQNVTPVVIGEITVSPASSEGYIVESQTLIPGSSAIEVAGTTYSLQVSGGIAVVNGQSVQITTLASPTESAVSIVLGGLTGRPASSEAYIVADQTLSRGGSAIEISGTTYSLAQSGESVVVNGEARPVSAVQKTLVQPATVVVGEVTAAPVSSGAYYLVAGQTLSPEASAIEVSGLTYSLPKSGANIVINGATSYANAASAPASAVLGSLTAASFMGGGFIVGSQVLSSGGAAVEVSGTTYSLATSGNTVLVNGVTTAVQPVAFTGPTSVADAASTPSPVIFGSVTTTPFIAGGYILATQILSPGGTAVEVSGTTYSLAKSGNTVFVNGQPTEYQGGTAAPLTVGSQTFNAVAASVTPLVVASQTIVPGGSAVTISGTTYSLPSSGTGSIVVNGQTTTLAQTSGVAVLTVNPQQISFTPLNSGLVVASQTLYPGEAITVNGETLSLATSGSVVIVKSGASTTTEGLGDYIWQGIATSASASTTGSASESSRKSGSAPTSGSTSASTTSRSSGTGTETASEGAAATTSASRAGHTEVRVMSWFAVLICFVLAALVM